MQGNDHRRDPRDDAQRPRRDAELRVHGINACLAAFAKRPQDLRKVWLTEANVPAFKQVLAFCVKHRLGYRLVEADEIAKLTASSHHEGVCFAMLRHDAPTLDDMLSALDANAPACLIWLHGVGNPHNLGAILRSAAHFGVRAALLSDGSGLSPAAYRVSEGGAESVSCVDASDADAALMRLRRAGFQLAATTVRDGASLYASALPKRTVFLLGAESTGLPQALIDRADLRLRIPGTGAVESLNVSVASALLMAEWARVHGAGD